MNQNDIRTRARALGLSDRLTATCLKYGCDPERYINLRTEVDAKSKQGRPFARWLHRKKGGSLEKFSRADDREIVFGRPTPIDHRSRPTPTARTVAAAAGAPQLSARELELCRRTGADPRRYAELRSQVRRA